MAYVVPNSTIEYFGDLGLDSNYSNTVWFPDTESKDSAFDGISKLAAESSCSYISKDGTFFRSSLPMETLVHSNYIRFKNTSFENKWFYAFVDSVDYANNGMTEVHFTIDVIMTWTGDFILGQCFIERQHVHNDAIGANIADEGLDTGEYICEGFYSTQFFTDYDIAILSSTDPEGQPAAGVYGGLFSGVYIETYANWTDAASAINQIVTAQKADEVIAIKMLPRHYTTQKTSPNPVIDLFTIPKPYTKLGQYTPRNNKLFCYPYNMLVVYNSEGETAELRYEYFNALPPDSNSDVCQFSIDGFANAECVVTCIPRNYYGLQSNLGARLTMRDFPTCAFNVDQYKAYLAQKETNAVLNIANSVASPLTIETRGMNVAGTIVGEIGSLLAAHIVHPPIPVQSRGTQSVDLFVGEKIKDFYFYQMCITENYAIMIDSFFDMFGYAVRQHGTPSMHARKSWTYVKTKDCIVHGNIPSNDAAIIERCFNNGIRFWASIENIGDYTQNNDPLT